MTGGPSLEWPTVPTLAELPAPPKRVILHWTAGRYVASTDERTHYHYLAQSDGQIVSGVPVANNMRQLARGSVDYAAHTRGFNSFSVGMAACGMMGAIQGGDLGRFPLLEGQVKSLCRFAGYCCRLWDLPVTQDTVFTHAEAPRLHGVSQAGKWDIDVLPWLPDLTPEQVGQWLRAQVAEGP